MHMNRTVRIPLQATPEQADALAETTRLFTDAFNTVCAYGWEHGETNGVHLHHATYYACKSAAPALVSDLHIQARVKATEAIKSALTLKRKSRKISPPMADACPPRYNVHTFKVDWNTRRVRLSTAQGRMSLPFHVPEYATAYVGGKVATADLIQHDGAWRLHIVVDIPAPIVQATDEIMGVDLGLAQPAVTSTNQFLGEKRWRALEGLSFKLRRVLQTSGTKSAKRHLREMRRRQSRFRRDCDHVLSKQIIMAAQPGSTIVLENLTNIRRRITAKRKTANKRRLHGWSFAQLNSFIRYKAEARGCTVVGVDPRHTSQTCSRCGHIARNNRRARAWFKCRVCDFELHADLNGARNIAAKYRASLSKSEAGEPPCQPAYRGEP